MADQDLIIPERDWRKLLAAANADSTLLYLYLRAGGNESQAQNALRFSDQRMEFAVTFLKQVGLWAEQPHVVRPAQPPAYSEMDLIRAQEGSHFPRVLGEAQRRLGKVLSTEECKVLLSIYEYLGMSEEVVSILLCYCIQRAKARGSVRNPSMHTIEREAYHWADLGIDTMEEAASYMQMQLERQSKIGRIRTVLQISDRKLTAGEEKLAAQWVDWGFGEDVIKLAYEKTCMNTGGLKWPYLNSILKSWHEQGLLTAAAVKAGDKGGKPATAAAAGSGKLSDLDLAAIERMIKEQEG